MAWLVSRKSRTLGRIGTLLLAGLVGGVDAETAFSKPTPTPSSSGDRAVLAYLSLYLEGRGVSPEILGRLQPQNLTMPSPPPASATLQVTRCRWDVLRQEIEFYVRCSNPRVCRPFLAVIHPRNGGVLSALRKIAPGGQAAPGSIATSGIQEFLPRETLLIQAGEHVRLVLAGPNVRIKLSAICLDRGALGQQVRARGIGDTKVFLARVMGPGWLAAEFP